MSRSSKKLCLATLGELHTGVAQLIIDRAIQEAVSDIDDRGEDGKKRKVNIRITLQKREDGMVETDVTAKADLPARQTAATVTRPMGQSDGTKLVFESFSPDNPDQASLLPEEGK